MRRSLNLNWIRSFEASARLLSFTKAAQGLMLAQAGVSQPVLAGPSAADVSRLLS
jgi:DNA-binding transcriptional LysR family regulator